MNNKCVVCGEELPEGYGHVCKNCENAVTREVNQLEEVKKRISFSYGDNPCVSIQNSYLIVRDDDIKVVLEYIRGLDGYKKLKELGYTRTPKSEFNEWKGHNVLYKLGFMRSHTGSVDINQNEPKWRKAMYAILSIL
jgi:hypothetical protein